MYAYSLAGNPWYTGNDIETKKRVDFHKDTLCIIASSAMSDNWEGKLMVILY